MRYRGLLLAAVILVWTAAVRAAEGPPVGVRIDALPVHAVTLADVYGAEQTLRDYAGRPVILSISSRTTSDDANTWGRQVSERLGERDAEFARFRVVDLSDVARPFRGIARRRLRKAWNEGHTLLADWGGAFAAALDLDPAQFHIVAVGGDGVIRGAIHGPCTPAALDAFAALLE